MRPRPNDQVNQFYMCDEGRLDYRWINRTDRVEVPHVRRDGRMAPADWDVALDEAVRVLTRSPSTLHWSRLAPISAAAPASFSTTSVPATPRRPVMVPLRMQ